MEQSKTLTWVVVGVVVLALAGIGWYFFGNSSPSFNTPTDDGSYGASQTASSTNTSSSASSTDNYYQPPAGYQPSGS